MSVTITSTPDMAQLCALHAESFARGWSKQEFAELLAAKEVQAFVAADYAGFGLLRVIEDEAEVLTFAVAKKLQRQGIGTAIMDLMLDYAKAQGVRSVFLEVKDDNEAARELYGSLGFEEILRRKKYYSLANDVQKDAIVMCLEFS